MLIVFYGFMIIYLYGDLCIYLSVVGTTLQGLSCPKNSTKSGWMVEICHNLGLPNIFRIFAALFFAVTAPFTFMNLKKSVLVQITTMVMRFIAVVSMVSCASARIARGASHDIAPVRLAGIPNFFGVCLYSFMCQHSLPSMVNYVTNKNARFNYWILGSMVIALVFYLITLLTATLAFKGNELFSLYTMNFDKEEGILSNVIYYYLMMFPTIALLGSYPIVSITLRENLISFTQILINHDLLDWVRTWVYPPLAILPPFILVMMLPGQVLKIASYVGTYVGSFVQYFIPACLVLWARRCIKRDYPEINMKENPHSVNFLRNVIAPSILLIWTFIGIGIVTYYEIKK